MSNLSFRVHYLNVQPSEMLTAAIRQGIELLTPHRDRVAHCDVHVGRWVQHHDVATTYRVVLELEPEPGSLPVSVECESPPNPKYPALLKLVGEAFRRAERRLSARLQHASGEPTSRLSAEARRLHPLHGLAHDDVCLGAVDER